MPTVQLRDPVSGQIFDVEESEAQNAQRAYKFEPATPDQVAAFDRERAAAAKPLGQKVLETAGTVGAGLASAGNVIGDVIPESLGGLSDAEVAQFNTEFSGSPLVKGLKEEHPIAFALGSSAPAIALGPAVGAAAGGGLAGGVAGTLAESAAVGLGDESIAAGAEGREFDEGRAVEGAQTDLAFSAAAQALLGVAGRVGNLFLFGGGNTMAKNVGRGLDETVGPVVPDDIRFESPLLEAETRSTRAAAAASPGMPPGPARDEALRRAAADLNEQVRTQGGEALETTVAEAQRSASVADSPVVQRRIDEILTETTPAQTSWSADATQRLDKMRQAAAADPAAARAVAVADEAIKAIDGVSDSAEWFKASAAARDRLDVIADAMPESPAAKTIADARDWLGKSLADRGMWGTAADLDASLRGAARDKVATAARTVGGDLRGHVAAYVDADGAGRAGLRATIDQAIEGVEELAAAHERFGTATPKQIETLRENAAGLRRRIALADDVLAAEGRAAQQVAEETPAKATMVEQAAEAVASHLEKGGRAALSAGIGRALTTIADFAGIPGAGWVARKIRGRVGDAVADQVIAAAKQYDPASPGGKRVRRIMDRMRAAERQRGAVTLGGKKRAPKPEPVKPLSMKEFIKVKRRLDPTEDEAKAFAEYKGSGYRGMNGRLRGEPDVKNAEYWDARNKVLSGFLDRQVKAGNVAPGTVFRTMNADRLPQGLKPGDIYTPPGYISTSQHPQMAQTLESGNIKTKAFLQIEQKTGVPVPPPKYSSDTERELLLRPKTRLEFVGMGEVNPGEWFAQKYDFDKVKVYKFREVADDAPGAKLENGMTEAEYQAKLAAYRARSGSKAKPPLDVPLDDIQVADKEGYLEAATPRQIKKHSAEIKQAAETALAGKSIKDLGALPLDEGPGATASRAKIDAFKKDQSFRETGMLPSNNDRGRGGLPAFTIEPDGKVYLQNGRHRLTAALESGQPTLVANLKKYDKKGNIVWDYVGPVRVGGDAAPKATGEAGFVQAAPDERQFSLGDIAKSPAGVVTGAGVAWAGINQLRRDDDLETADRVIAVDDAAQQRVRHTARVLAGLAEPPQAEGLTTALGRFGADHEDPRAAFEDRKSILEKAATAPALVYDVIGSALGDVARVSPELFQAASQRLLEGFQYLRDNLPAEVKTSMLYPTGVPPSESAMRDWATQWNTVMDPESVLDDVERGTVSHLQIRTLEGAHPDIYQSMRTEVIAEVGANFQEIPWSTKMSLDLLFQADGLAGPAFSSKAAAMIGEAMQSASQRKTPGPAVDGSADAAANGPSGLESIRTSVTNRSVA